MKTAGGTVVAILSCVVLPSIHAFTGPVPTTPRGCSGSSSRGSSKVIPCPASTASPASSTVGEAFIAGYSPGTIGGVRLAIGGLSAALRSVGGVGLCYGSSDSSESYMQTRGRPQLRPGYAAVTNCARPLLCCATGSTANTRVPRFRERFGPNRSTFP